MSFSAPCQRRLLARICWAIDARRWLVSASNLAAGACFVFGCVVFYSPALYRQGVTLFLVGSLFVLFAAAAETLLRHGPSS